MSGHLLPALLVATASEATPYLADLLLIVGVAALCATAFQRLGLPIVLGYLLAGFLVGPHMPARLAVHPGLAHSLSDMGIILLMFSLGLEFSLRRLIRTAPSGGLVALIECSLVTWLGYVSGRLLGWSATASIFAGAICAISSTTIIAKTFVDKGIGGRLGELVFSVLVAEDLIAILLLAVLTAVGAGGTVSAAVVGQTAGRLLGFLIAMLAGGMLVVPRLVRLIARGKRPETLLLSCLALALGLAYLAQQAGYSVAFGAFLAGALISESGEAKKVEALVRPLRHVFAGVFFVSVGMLLDLSAIRDHWSAVLLLSAVVVAGKVLGVSLGAFVAGNGVRLAIQSGMSLAQIGEFSFIIAGLGTAAGVLPGFLFPVAIAVSAVTTLLTPFLIRGSASVASYVDRRLPHAAQTFAALYGSWVKALGESRNRPEWKRVRRLASFLVLDVVIIAGLVIASSLVWPYVARALAGHLPSTLARALVTAAAIALALPFFWSALRTARRLGRLLAEGAFPASADGVDLAEAPRRALRAALELAILFAAGAPLVALTQPFLPTAFPFAVVLVVGVALLGLPFWRSATNLEGHVRAGAQAILETLVAQSRSGHPPPNKLDDLCHLLPGIGEPRAVALDRGAPCLGHSLKDLNLRGLTGATVLAIERGAGEVVFPTADEVLRENDVLVLTGTGEAVAAASEFLSRPRRPSLVTSDGDLVG
ncbi:MAG: cation:proton antiporter [Deltaproteobacteria bacterium]|nr:cation:proton antiporter [Deltaproteobacteria bacterium]